MDEYTKRFFDAIIDGTGLAFSLATLILAIIIYKKGIKEYQDNNRTKRAEFLEKLIESFNHPSIEIAKKIIDDFVYPETEFKNDEEYYNLPCVNLIATLRNHRDTTDGITNPIELEIRESFSVFLDFLSKLSYYLKNGLISPNELGYFKYYIDRINYLVEEKSSDDEKRDEFRKKGIKVFIETYFLKEDYERLFKAL